VSTDTTEACTAATAAATSSVAPSNDTDCACPVVDSLDAAVDTTVVAAAVVAETVDGVASVEPARDPPAYPAPALSSTTAVAASRRRPPRGRAGGPCVGVGEGRIGGAGGGRAVSLIRSGSSNRWWG
jgi:hypothetical protein